MRTAGCHPEAPAPGQEQNLPVRWLSPCPRLIPALTTPLGCPLAGFPVTAPHPPEAGLRAPRVRAPLLGRFSLGATLSPPLPSRFPHINNSKCERKGPGPAWAEGGLRLAARSPAPSRSLGPRRAGINGILFYFSLSRGRCSAHAGGGRPPGGGGAGGGRKVSQVRAPDPSPHTKAAPLPRRRRGRGAGVLGAAGGGRGRTHPLGGIVLLHHSGWARARARGEGAGWRSCPRRRRRRSSLPLPDSPLLCSSGYTKGRPPSHSHTHARPLPAPRRPPSRRPRGPGPRAPPPPAPRPGALWAARPAPRGSIRRPADVASSE